MKLRPGQIRLAKTLDIQLGRLLSMILPLFSFALPKRTRPSRVRKILFVKFWGMGSIILTEPALRRLSEKYPRASIHYLTLQENRELLTMFPTVTKTHSLPSDGIGHLLRGSLQLIRRLRKEDYDLVYDAEFLVHFSALVARLSGGCWVAGFDSGSGAKRYLQDRTERIPDDLHASQEFLLLVQGEVEPLPLRAPRLKLFPEKNPWKSARPYVVVNINSGPLALERRWPRNRFAKLLQFLLEQFDFPIMIIGSKAETEYVDGLFAQVPPNDRLINFAGQLSVTRLAALIRDASLLISNDSGPVHLAAALDVPVAAFFGPESPRRYGPLTSRKRVFYRHLTCSPCMKLENLKTVTCHHGQNCLKGIEVDDVVEDICALLDTGKSSQSPVPRRLVSLCV